MSNALAIAATTATLRNLLTRGLPTTDVTVRPPDKARNGGGNQVNVFLYQVAANAAWRNQDLPWATKSGESGHPPLPLNLHYLITAYGEGDDDERGHAVLGQAMSILHDHCLLGAGEILNATQANLGDSDLHAQPERIRITLQPLSLDEISKLWAGFQTQYRLSAAYQVAVVLIESTRAARTPLPVLKRGEDDRGVTSQADLTQPFPTIEDIRVVDGAGQVGQSAERMSFELGERFALLGHHFAGDDGNAANVTVTVNLDNLRLAEPLLLDIPANDRTDKQILVTIPDQPADVPAGVYTLSVTVAPNNDPDRARATSEVPLLIAPKISSAMPTSVALDAQGEATLTLNCKPEVRPEQRVTLHLDGHTIPAQPRPSNTGTLQFVVRGLAQREYRARLRVDGVDSRLIDRTDPQNPKFDETQKITLT